MTLSSLMTIVLLALCVFILSVLYSIIRISTDYDQACSDEEQLKFLRQWRQLH